MEKTSRSGMTRRYDGNTVIVRKQTLCEWESSVQDYVIYCCQKQKDAQDRYAIFDDLWGGELVLDSDYHITVWQEVLDNLG